MMKLNILLPPLRLMALFLLLLPALAFGKQRQRVFLADPFILYHEGLYYAYGTGASDGIEVYTSKNLRAWTRQGLALHRDDVWGDHWFWAPEVYEVDGIWYMYFTAEEHICVATATSPLGPFRQQEKKPMIASEKCIDHTLFRDDDGQAWLFFDRFNDGLNVWVAQLEDDLTTLRPETMRPCIHVSQPWEEVWPRVNEGSFVIKHKGKYYMTYSANSYESPMYGLGCATATSPTGPWTKYEEDNPLLQRPGQLVGVGHNAIFRDRRGHLWAVFHAHHDTAHIHPRAMYLSRVRFRRVNGEFRMRISQKYKTPYMKPEKGNQSLR
ncbi:MAG: glycoside hydrolase family 43 protein [Bacteroidaceae bacterium]|nr:glycoside hydrolase family 43 protein [Bacteroidaceae bacterium]